MRKVNIQLENIIRERTSEIAFQNEELKKQTEQIRMQSDTLAESNAAKDKFFKIIAHDLRRPISGVMKLTDLMANQSENFSVEEYAEISKMLNRSAGNLYELMNNLLEWATAQSEGIKLELKDCGLYSMAEENIRSLGEAAIHKHIEIQNRVNKSIGVRTDEKMFNTVMRNLISNAIKFTNSGGRIIVDAVVNDMETCISVSDNGIGISQDNIGRLFKLDERVGRKGTDDEKSTGLGLVLCKEFVSIHGGRIWAESEEGKGSTFFFTIPSGGER